MKNEKGFTLIESLVAFAIATMVFAALSTVITTTYRYYTASNKIKALSDIQYQAVLNPKATSTDHYTLKCTIDDKEEASINNLNLTTNTSKSYDDVTVAYFNLTNDIPLADKTTQQLTNTVYDRLQFKNSTNDKGEWSLSKASSYRKGDFVTYEDRQYVLVTDNNLKTNWEPYTYKAPGTYQSGWQLLDMYNPSAPLFTTYLNGDIFLQNNGDEIQAFVYLDSNPFTWIGAYDPKTHEIKKDNPYAYDKNAIHYFDEWKDNQMYLNESWKNQGA